METLIVVLGVFLGLQVNNWNAARLEHAQEREYLIWLHEDFTESAAGQSRDIRFLGHQLSDQGVILKSLEACAVTAISYTTRERRRAYRPMLEQYEDFLSELDAELGKN